MAYGDMNPPLVLLFSSQLRIIISWIKCSIGTVVALIGCLTNFFLLITPTCRIEPPVQITISPSQRSVLFIVFRSRIGSVNRKGFLGYFYPGIAKPCTGSMQGSICRIYKYFG